MDSDLPAINDLSLLYDLSLVVGSSLELTENIIHFLTVLLDRKKLSYAAVWLKKNQLIGGFGENGYKLIAGIPKNRVRQVKAKENTLITRYFSTDQAFSLTKNEEGFESLIQEKNISRGAYAIFDLGGLGFLKLYDEHKKNGFPKNELEQLNNVVHKFANSILACLTFQKLHQEINYKVGLEKQKIVEQQNANLLIERSEHKLRQIINTSLDAVISIDQKGNITEWSKRAEALFGFSREEVMGQSMGALIVPERYREAHAKGMSRFLKTGYGPVLNQRIEITAIDKNKREFPIELSISPIKIDKEYIFSGLVRDISGRKQAENDLLQAQKEAEQARLAEQKFLANMSHEIRTPMNSVIGMTHLLYETSPSDVQREYLDILKFSADSLLGIINNILDISKIGAGEFELEPRPFNLKELILSLRQTFRFKVRDKPINVVAEVDVQIENYLVGDDTRLNQILTNLLGNASKFTHKGTIGIKVNQVTKQNDKCWVEFNIHDTGVGIEEEKIPLIFEDFKQIEAEANRKFGGTGLGLSIVKQLVSLQKGTIEVKSILGKGSEFIIVLPFKDSGTPLTEIIYPEVSSLLHKDLLTKVSILVVEDNMMNQRLITKLLDLWKCSFDLVYNGQEAFRQSKEKRYDIILMDIHMPIMDGIESAGLIRSDTTNPNFDTPIIALTAAALSDERNRVFEVGMNDFLTKPFSPSALESTILKWLDFQPVFVESTSTELEKEYTAVDANLDYLKAFSNNDIDFMQEMIYMFIYGMPEAISKLKEYQAEKNWKMVYKTAHRMKSNFMMMGMKSQEKSVETLEMLTKQQKVETEQVVKIIDTLEKDTKEVYPLLKELADKLT